jgi:hypothetical protein
MGIVAPAMKPCIAARHVLTPVVYRDTLTVVYGAPYRMPAGAVTVEKKSRQFPAAFSSRGAGVNQLLAEYRAIASASPSRDSNHADEALGGTPGGRA